MKTVILCGGLGARLREETEFRPKPMVEIGGRPILWHIMKIYAHAGFSEFVLCLGYRGNMIKEYFLNYEATNNDFTMHLGRQRKLVYHGAHAEQDFSVTLADTGENSMTGGRLKRIARYLKDDVFMVTYGDGVADLDVRKLVEFHKSHGKIATVTTVKPISRFGMLEADRQGRVTEFSEKPKLDDWVSAGFFVFGRQVFDYIAGDGSILEREPVEALVRDRQLMAYRHDGFFHPMDTYRDYQHLNDLWANEKAPWKIWK